MPKQIRTGRCRLTGIEGKFVKCHILPLALTKPSKSGRPLLQTTKGKGAKRRWSSWFDQSIVTREGEDILSSIDNRGIKILRSHRMVWSSWVVAPPPFHVLFTGRSSLSIRKLRLEAPEELHLFVLSILWRAAVSNLPEMEEVELSDTDIELIGQMLQGKSRVSPSFFPTSVTQIVTRGQQQNLSPIQDIKRVLNPNTGEIQEHRIFRIYLDGCIFHVHRDASDVTEIIDGPNFIGGCENLIITGVDYDRSWQYENFLITLYEAYLGPLGSRISPV